MKIVIQKEAGASQFVRDGWHRCLSYCGHEVHEFHIGKQAIFDVFSRAEQDKKPIDIFLGTTYGIDNTIEKLIRQKPNLKVGLFASAFGPIINKIDLKEYPIHYISEEEKERLGKLKRETGKPDLVYIHITDRHLEQSLAYWGALNIKYIGLLNAADTFVYLNAKFDPKYQTDISFVGGYWPYKAKTLNKYIGRLSNDSLIASGQIGMRVYGYNWQLPQYLGSINHGEDAKIFASSKICPNISEGHSYIFDDIVERVFKVPCANGFLICDNVSLKEIGLEGITPQFSSYEEFRSLIEKFSKNESNEERLALTSQMKDVILGIRNPQKEGHTYFDRMAKLMLNLGFSQESDNILAHKVKYLGEMGYVI